jgi:hypothetical protein
MSHEIPYWELGRVDDSSYPFSKLVIQKNTGKLEKLETDLIQFVNSHHDIFDDQEIESIKRVIIRAFGMMQCQCGMSVRPDISIQKPGLSVIAQLILQIISDKIKRREINVSHEVNVAIIYFEVCADFINTFLPDLCDTEQEGGRPQGYSGLYFSNREKCKMISNALNNNWSSSSPNIFRSFQSVINRYQARVLKLWADVLIRKNKITSAEIAETHSEVDAKDGTGYERKMRELLAECGGGYAFTPNLDVSMLLKWLTLFHVAIAKDEPYMRNLTKTYTNGGKASTLDGIVFGIISQFVPIHNVSRYSYIPASINHESELNMLNLTCNVVEKNPHRSGNTQQPPVCAYLSSDVLDQCVQNFGGRFPTTDEFIQYTNTRTIEKAAAFSPPPPPSPPPRESAPPLSDLDGGKKIMRKTNKKRRHSKNRRHSRHRR